MQSQTTPRYSAARSKKTWEIQPGEAASCTVRRFDRAGKLELEWQAAISAEEFIRINGLVALA